MSGLNKVMLIGHLGAAPEIRSTQDGRKLAQFNLATGESWKDKTTGERKDRTEWHRVVVFNEGLTKVAEQYLKKGSKIYLEGALRTRKWTDSKAIERYTTEIILGPFGSVLVMLDRAEKAPPPDEGAPPAGAPAPGPRVEIDDEIPF